MRKIIAYFSHPGRFIILVAAMVLLGAALLWRSTRAVPEHAVAHRVKTSVTARDATSVRALLDMANRAFEEPLADSLKDTKTFCSADGAKPAQNGSGRIVRRRSPGEVARLAIVIDDNGEDMRALRMLLRLPFTVTCAVWPRSTNARRAAETAHAAGREVIIHQPTEPMTYPEMDPGPGALFVSFSDAAIEELVRDSLNRVPYAIGMNNHMGSRFTRDARAASAMVRPLKDAGFFVLDSMTHPDSVLYKEAAKLGIPTLKRDIFLDAEYSKANVLRQLRKAERLALVTGRAIAIGHPLPGTLAALKEWEGMRDPQVELVKLSDLINAP